MCLFIWNSKETDVWVRIFSIGLFALFYLLFFMLGILQSVRTAFCAYIKKHSKKIVSNLITAFNNSSSSIRRFSDTSLNARQASDDFYSGSYKDIPYTIAENVGSDGVSFLILKINTAKKLKDVVIIESTEEPEKHLFALIIGLITFFIAVACMPLFPFMFFLPPYILALFCISLIIYSLLVVYSVEKTRLVDTILKMIPFASFIKLLLPPAFGSSGKNKSVERLQSKSFYKIKKSPDENFCIKLANSDIYTYFAQIARVFDAHFIKCTFSDDAVMLCVYYNKDAFEICTLFNSVYDCKNYRNFFEEISVLLKFIDYLQNSNEFGGYFKFC